ERAERAFSDTETARTPRLFLFRLFLRLFDRRRLFLESPKAVIDPQSHGPQSGRVDAPAHRAPFEELHALSNGITLPLFPAKDPAEDPHRRHRGEVLGKAIGALFCVDGKHGPGI